MGKYIGTCLHKALELAPDEEFFLRCSTLPHYVIDPTLVDLLSRADVRTSIAAMVEANIARLPFSEMVVEMDQGKARSIVLLKEDQGSFSALAGSVHGDLAAEVDPFPYKMGVVDAGVLVSSSEGKSHAAWMRTAGVTLAIALLMLNIQGVEKEVIDPSRLNRQRAANGKPRVPRHVVVRIGHVYGRNGEKIGHGRGRTLPVHLRAGHTRRQHFGEGNTHTRFVFIPPVLVNFKPGAVAPVPNRIIAA